MIDFDEDRMLVENVPKIMRVDGKVQRQRCPDEFLQMYGNLQQCQQFPSGNDSE